MTSQDLLLRARAWLDDDSDPEDRAELSRLIDLTSNDPSALAELSERFSGPLEFGTAGLRGLIGAGESRMCSAVVRRTTWGLCQHLLATVPDARARGIVLGRDGRRRSDEFLRQAAGVAIALGIRVHLYPGPIPTPLVSFAVRSLEAAAGVAVTASHNPPEYNGYKVFREGGAQIVPPEDAAIATLIARAPKARDLEVLPIEGSSLVHDATPVEATYLETLAHHPALHRDQVVRPLRIAYTALHGVGERLARAALAREGHEVFSVAEQAEPDGRFPTVRFPNPEEPGAMDMLLEVARASNADLAIANDPDADRLAVAVPNGRGGLQVLTGDEVGVLLGEHALRKSGPGVVISTVVSSTQLGRIARAMGSTHAETLTGFKWIAARGRALEAEGSRFVFGYEEALGYAIGGITWDKDGISAAVAFASLAAELLEKKLGVLDHLAELRRIHGFHCSKQKNVVLPGASGQKAREAAMVRLRERPPRSLGGLQVRVAWDLLSRTRRRGDSIEGATELPASNVVIFDLEGGARAAVRPSGTEPKIKLYLEVVEDLGVGRERAESRAAERLEGLARDLSASAGLS
ncbi:MAG: phospho-sugar mutase [Deltaproteobacteria bacterium]|nr:phospho-sugar mutase [Deltaproteobacteria bacterium]